MKTVRWFFCITLLLVLFVGYHNSQMNNNTDNAVMTDTEYILDIEYREAINACISNAEISNTNSLYAKKWKDLGEYYYQCITACEHLNSKDEIKSNITSIHNEWNQYVQRRINLEEKRLTILYGAGSIIPIKLSQYEYDLYRAHAIELYEMCLQLHIDCKTL